MLRSLIRLLVIFTIVSSAWAAAPIGRVSSSQPFEMNGALVPVDGVPSWPLFPGDVVLTHAAPATVTFRGGSRIILDPNSELKIESKDKKPALRLLSGSGKYFVGGAVVAISTAAAIVIAEGNNGFTPGAQGYQKPPNPSPSR